MYSFSSKLWYDKRWISKSKEASLYLQVVINREHKSFPLKLKWPVDKIDLVNGTLLPRAKYDPDVNDYNLLIRMEQSKHTEILRTYRIKQQPIDIAIFSKQNRVYNQQSSFTSFMFREIEDRYKRKEIVKRTYTNHLSINTLMIEFDATWLFKFISAKWMKRFRQFLVNRNYAPGNIWTIIKSVKAYLNLASADPMIYVNQDAIDFSNPEPKWQTSYLNKEEIRKLLVLYKKNSLTSEQKNVLRAFLFTCYTSLRVSDVYRANAKWNITGDSLNFIPKKNERKGKWVSVPLIPLAKQFVINTLGLYFDLPSEAQYNRDLKAIAIHAGINKPITSHYGRHTFGYLYMTTAGNLKGLQEIMGHSKIETTMRYAHLDQDYKYTSVMKIQEEFPDMLMKVI